MTLLPVGFLDKWRGRARAGNLALLENVIEFVQEFYDELNHGDKIQAYKEAAEVNVCSEYTFRDRVSKVVRFRDCDLREWFENGIGWDHLENAPMLKPNNPAGLINECIAVGNADGGTMTVAEMQNFVLEGEGKQKAKAEYHFNRWFGKLGNLPKMLKWNDEKSKEFTDWLNEGKARFFQ